MLLRVSVGHVFQNLINFIRRCNDRDVDVLLGQLRDGGEVTNDERDQVRAHLDGLFKLIADLSTFVLFTKSYFSSLEL